MLRHWLCGMVLSIVSPHSSHDGGPCKSGDMPAPPQVIEMTSVSSASDIWSVGCLAIELLTGNPPYSELQPMSAMFRVVQDAHPPLPKGVSKPMHSFLMQCFRKVRAYCPLCLELW